MPTTIDPAVTISADHARRFLARRQLLAPPRALPAEPVSVLRVVDRLGLLQFDPIAVPGARSHDILLHSRIAGYRRGWCEEWLYGEDRRLIELYNKSLNILPMSEFGLHRIAWDLYAPPDEKNILHERADLARTILDRIESDGPLSTAAFADHAESVAWWWAPTPVGRAVLEALFMCGRLGIARRDGSRRYYDLIERVVPAGRLAERATEEAGRRHRLLSHFRATGMASPTEGTPAEPMYRIGRVADRRRWTSELVEEGVLLPVAVEGLSGLRYLMAGERPLLDEVADPEAMPWPGASLIAPLDPLVWDRGLLRDLWGFEWMWEIYTPEARRRWGYYVLPILHGDRFAGRIEPRYDRRTRTLQIVGVSFEEDSPAVDDPDLVRALAEAFEAYRTFVGAERVVWPRSRPGRDLKAAIARVA
ncbi:MAG TPA: crosslink repair DNA glycosylase YcaQ family protein [Candidatus Dormibacteraeota bacterium]|jgi:hypothetical protein|nr:crosslink repair DNA glycosylase YcaQ family protein [Candidatus Dormibacteraeota bacterium]